MNPGAQGGEGAGGAGQQGDPNQLTVVASRPVTATTYITSTAYPNNQPASTTSSTASSTPTSTSTPASTAKPSSKIAVGPILGGAVGGVAVLSLLAVLLAVCLRGRKKRRETLDINQEKRSTAETTSYAGVNSAFSGVPFTNSSNQEHHDSNASLLPLPLSTPGTSPYSRAEMRGGELSPYSLDRHGGEAIPYPPPRHGGSTSPYSQDRHVGERSPSSILGEWQGGQTSPYALPGQRDSHFESEHFLQMYGENTTTASRESLGRIGNDIVSPISPHDQRPTATPLIISPESPAYSFDAPPGISVPMFLAPQSTRDTMGFPVDSDSIRSPEEQRHPSFPVEPMPLRTSPRSQDRDIERDHQNTPLASPSPGQPLMSQNSLSHLIRQGMTTPEPNLLKPERALSSEFQRESPILGNSHLPVRIFAPPPLSRSHQNIMRNASQKTVSSMGSIGPMVSDEELDRLGVGRI